MMDSSPHLIGLQVPCHVCKEPLIVPDKSSGESGSFVLAHAVEAAKAKKALGLVPETEDEPSAGPDEDLAAFLPKSPRAMIIAGVSIGAIVLVVTVATVWWVAAR
jgi:hypothetical protein